MRIKFKFSRSRTKRLGLIAAAVLVVLFWSSIEQSLFSLVAGPEGVRALAYGSQFGAYDTIHAASLLDPLPEQYVWESTQTGVMSISHEKQPGEPVGGLFVNGPGWWYLNDCGTVRLELQRPTLQDDPVGLSASSKTYFRYTKLNDSEVKIEKVIVQIVPADFILQLSIVPGRGIYSFEDLRLWFALDTVSWMNAYASGLEDPDPLTNSTVELLSSSYRGAFPLVAWVDEYQDWVWDNGAGLYRSNPPDDTAISYVQLEPSLNGRYIDLYTSPDSKYDLMLAETVIGDQALLEQALEPGWLPDPRFAETVYSYINLNKFGAYVKPTGMLGSFSRFETWYPSVYYRLRVVYAVYGEWVYLWTDEAAEDVGYAGDEWEIRTTTKDSFVNPIDSFFASVAGWFQDPLNLFGLGVAGILVLVVVVMVVVGMVAGGGFTGIFGLLLRSRRNKG